MALAVLSPWTWATLMMVLAAPVLLGLWLVASLTDDRLRVLPPAGDGVRRPAGGRARSRAS